MHRSSRRGLVLAGVVTLLFLLTPAVTADRPNLDVLYVDDSHALENNLENNSWVRDKFVPHLENQGVNLSIYNVDSPGGDGPTESKMESFDLVIWATGADSSTYDIPSLCDPKCPTIKVGSDRKEIQNYLDSNGRLFLTGQFIDQEYGGAGGNKQTFYQDYLRSQQVDQDDSTIKPHEIEAKYSSGNIFGYDSDWEYSEFNTSDVVNLNYGTIRSVSPSWPDDPQTREALYDDGDDDVIWCDNGNTYCYGMTTARQDAYKSIYMSHGFELISGGGSGARKTRQTVLDRIVDFLAGPEASDTTTSPVFVSDSEKGSVDISSVCYDKEYNGDGVLDAKYVINASTENNQDNLNNPRDGNGNQMTAEDGFYGEMREAVDASIDASSYEDENAQNGINVTVAVHCKDDNKPSSGEGYWGQYDMVDFVLDTVAPRRGEIRFQHNITNETTPVMELGTGLDPDDTDFYQLSCDQNGPWSSWRQTRGDTFNISRFDIEQGVGCSPGDGKKTVFMRVKDQAGNIQTDANQISSASIWLDTTPPDWTGNTPANGSNITEPGNISINGTDDLTPPENITDIDQELVFQETSQVYEYYLNTSFQPVWPEAGNNVFSANISDLVGNIITRQFNYTVDPFAPQLSTTLENDSYITSDRDIKIGVDENITATETTYWYNGSGSNRTFTPGLAFDPGWTQQQEGRQFLDLWVNDSVGNVNTTSFAYRIDNSPPLFLDPTPQNTTPIQSDRRIRIDIVDQAGAGIDTWTYNVDNGQNISRSVENINKSFEVSWGAEGVHNITFWANDTLGQYNRTVLQYTIDDTPPTFDAIGPDRDYLNGSARLEIDVSDDRLNVSRLAAYNETTWTNTTIDDQSGTLTVTPHWSTETVHGLDLWANDTVNNIRDPTGAERTWILDLTAPRFDAISPPNGSNITSAADISINLTDPAPSSGLGIGEANNGTTNFTYTSETFFDPNWTADQVHQLQAWFNDSVSNTNPTLLEYTVDDTPPVFTDFHPPNTSVIAADGSEAEITVDTFDATSLVKDATFESEGGSGSFTPNSSFDPLLDTEGQRWINLSLTDYSGNTNTTRLRYTVDDTAPTFTITPTGYINASMTFNITASDSPAGLGFASLYNGSTWTNVSLDGSQDSTRIDPHWSTEEEQTFEIIINDSVGNINTTSGSRLLDDTAPGIDESSPSNLSFVNGSTRIGISISNPGDISSALGLGEANDGTANQTFTRSGTIDPAWSTSAIEDLRVWFNDSVSNTNTSLFRYRVDVDPPVVTGTDPGNGSYVRSDEDITISLDDVGPEGGAGIDTVTIDDGSGNETYTGTEISLQTSWTSEGPVSLFTWKNDSVGNVNRTYHAFTVDDTPPQTTSNYTWNGWRASNISIALDATDNFVPETIRACDYNDRASDSCPLSAVGSPNVSQVIGCTQGNTCVRVLRYSTVDSAGNEETVQETANVSIDKQDPSLAIESPRDDRVGGTIEIRADIDDLEGSGIQDANYTVVNYSEGTQIFTEGDLNLSSSRWDYNVSWDTTADIPAFEDVNLTIEAVDRVGNRHTVNRTFLVDNEGPSVSVREPSDEFVNDDTPLDIRATRPGGTLANHTYSVYNTNDTSTVWSQGVNGSVQAGEHTFATTLDINGSWTDGFYTVDSTAWDTIDQRAASSSAFVLDRTVPTATITDPVEGTFYKDTITVTADLTDDRSIDTCRWRYRDDQGAWSSNSSLTCGSGQTFSFDTTDCDDDSDPDCDIQVFAIDAAGNTASDNISIRVDNSAPQAEFESPKAGRWFNQDFDVNYTVDDTQGLDSAVYRINYTSDPQDLLALNGDNISVDIGESCQGEGEDSCPIVINATNNVGTSTVIRRNVSIDTTSPELDEVIAEESSEASKRNITSEESITIQYNASFAGAVKSVYDNGGGNISFTEGADTAVDWPSNGTATMRILVEDRAGNLMDETVTFMVDDIAPAIVSESPPNTSIITPDEDIMIESFDQHSGSAVLEYFNNEDSFNRTAPGINQSFDPFWSTDGQQTLDVYVTDESGNLHHSMYRYTIDGTAPTIDSVRPDDEYINTSTNITVNVSDAIANVSRLGLYNGTTWDNVTVKNDSFGVEIDPGWTTSDLHNLTVWVNDSKDNVRQELYQWKVDAHDPVFTTISPANQSNITSSQLLEIKVEDPGSTFSSGLGIGRWYNGTQNRTFTTGSDFDPGWATQGQRTLTAWYNDSVQNVNSTSYSFTVDDEPPVFVDEHPINDSPITSDTALTVSVVDETTAPENMSFDNGDGFFRDISGVNASFDPLWVTEGYHWITVRATDYVLDEVNQNTTRLRYYVDDTAPIVSDVVPENDSTITPQDLTVDLIDEGVDVSVATASFDHRDVSGYTRFTPNASFDPLWSSEGLHTVDIRTNDTLGNEKVYTYHYTIDNSTPEIDTVSFNRSAIREGEAIGITVDASDEYAGIPNNGVTAELINMTNDATITTVQLSRQSGLYQGSFTGTADASTNVSVNVSVQDRVGFVSYDWNKSFLIDNQAPMAYDRGFNVSKDSTYEDIRIFRSRPLRHTVNVTDNFDVATVRLTRKKPSGTGASLSMAATDQETRSAIWGRGLTETGQLGLYNLTKLYMEDELGNSRTITYMDNTTYRAVAPRVRTSFATDLDAQRNVSSELTIHFNKTFTGDARLFIPPNEQGNMTEPYLKNITALSCAGCDLVASVNDSSTRAVNLSVTDQVNATVQTDLQVYEPEQDTNLTFRGRTAGFTPSKQLTVLAPSLNLSEMFCDDVDDCTVEQGSVFNLVLQAANLDDANHSGDALNVSGLMDSRDIDESNATGLLEAGQDRNITMSVVTDEVGNVTFTGEIRPLGTEYSDTLQETFHVRDTEAPNITETGATNNSAIVNVNSRAYIDSDIQDNLAVQHANMTVVRPAFGGSGNVTENVSAERSEGSEDDGTWEITYDETSEEGFYYVKDVFAVDNYSNRAHEDLNISFEVRELSVIASNNVTVPFTVGEPVRLSVNVTGNGTAISDVIANISKPRNVYESRSLSLNSSEGGFVFSRAYTNTSRSGNYDVDVEAVLGTNVTNTTEFDISYGSLETRSGDKRQDLEVPDGATFNLSWVLDPKDGDVINTSSYVDLGPGFTAASTTTRETGNITYEEGMGIEEWEVTTSSSGTPEDTFAELYVNSSTPDTEISERLNITITSEDSQNPEVVQQMKAIEALNIGQDQWFSTNVTDNSVIDSVKLQVTNTTFDDVFAENLTMQQAGLQNYTTSYEPTANGTYKYTVFARDIGGNWGRGTVDTFQTFSRYNVSIDVPFSIYNKGNDVVIEVEAEDVAGRTVEGFNTTLSLDKGGSVVDLLPNNATDKTTYQIVETDPPSSDDTVVYTVESNISKDGNTGNASTVFNVTRLLNVTFLEPAEGAYIQPGTPFDVAVKVEDFQGNPVNLLPYVECGQCDRIFRFLTEREGEGVYSRSDAFVAPGVDGGSLFQLLAYASDGENRQAVSEGSGLSSVRREVSTTNDSSGQDGASSGGGGGGGGGGGLGPSFDVQRIAPNQELPSNVSEVNMTVETTLAGECRYTIQSVDIVRIDAMERFAGSNGNLHWSTIETDPGESYPYEVYCESTGGENATTDMFFRLEEEAISQFNMSLPSVIPPNEGTIEQGESATAPLSISNEGNTPINVNVSASVEDCCSAAVWESENQEITTFTLEEGEARDLLLNVDVPLNTERDTYRAQLSVESGDLRRSPSIQFEVVKGQRIQRLEDLQDKAAEINRTIWDYRRSGIDTTSLEQQYAAIEEQIRFAEKAISQDDRTVLDERLEQADGQATELEGRLRALAFQNYVRETWWRWLLGGFTVYSLFFLLTMVAIPYYRLRTDYLTTENKLESAVEARKKAERQYFKRQIDRDTFMDIMTERQDEVLELRGERDDLEEEIDNILEDRLTLENYLKAPIKAVREVNRWIEARRTKAETEEGESE